MSDNCAFVGVNKCDVDSECGWSSSLTTESEDSDHEVIVYCIQKLVNFCLF